MSPVSRYAGIFPFRKSTMIFPVGVGFLSIAPMGAVGLTITAGSPLPMKPPHLLFGEKFRSLVMSRHVLEPGRCLLAARFSVLCGGEHAHGARVDDLCHVCLQRRLHHVDRSLDVYGVHGLRVRDPQPVIGARMVYLIAAPRCPQHRGVIPEVPLRLLHVEGREHAGIRARP